MTTNNAWNSRYPADIASGGTNAASFATTNGILKYDGTRLVTSTTAKIGATNILTNTSQPAFSARTSADVNNVTGDGTNYTIICDTVVFDQTSSYNSSTGVFTAPVAGIYAFMVGIALNNIGALHTSGRFIIDSTSELTEYFQCNPSLVKNSSNNVVTASGPTLFNLSASDTVFFHVVVAGSTKTVGISGAALATTTPYCFFKGYLVC